MNSDCVTRGVRVRVESQFVPERSDPLAGQYFFAYTVTIANEGAITVQLVSRHWIITDGLGGVEEVRGPGVVGEQPVLAPGESFTYTSACPLPTETGSMRGTYRMVAESGDEFDATIAPFALAPPHVLN